ncbi:calcium-binding protein [Pseudoxanthomonas broegbernensis]|uniref:Calcium-binding protein n=1 Tax=Pseudoxanthomonas broegbernensis TaxID=83619 RepID=A0A7V8GNZ0_9GAMM|nr:EF-hand domain-containing protein [Pseudoxanthomonas broegbernensis]KAF1687375.1 calcium-binding protein [Pseudoxanthomonas broegbernensis]MBB6065619.1 hypothetical protein [Pseudoxanthomonas broegbernensis]
MTHPRLIPGFLILGLAAAPLAMAQTAPTDAQPAQAESTHAPATGAAEQQAHQSAARGEGLSWADLDADGNGNLSRQEAQRHAGLANVFAEADSDADGELTGDEYRSYVQKQQADAAQE